MARSLVLALAAVALVLASLLWLVQQDAATKSEAEKQIYRKYVCGPGCLDYAQWFNMSAHGLDLEIEISVKRVVNSVEIKLADITAEEQVELPVLTVSFVGPVISSRPGGDLVYENVSGLDVKFNVTSLRLAAIGITIKPSVTPCLIQVVPIIYSKAELVEIPRLLTLRIYNTTWIVVRLEDRGSTVERVILRIIALNCRFSAYFSYSVYGKEIRW